ncbi:LPS export ABC transporter permease LptG [Haloferula luteola]|uniref:LPS export ABC transporter permease LptG n=1 Tax=Haloferula luteola TaxID=595692 RepID=A0A840VDJ1_9BACT|nr:LptF/LptG family permease [Haloferula luteola]MBB5351889.1 LPS export ABC transporter permease LptG [Haloferula luteola]
MSRRFLPCLILLIAGIALAAVLVPQEQAAVTTHLASFPDADATFQQLRPWVLAGLCLVPALGGLFYGLGGTLARYVTRQFLVLLGLAFSALLMIWLLIDFQDNLSELRSSQNVGLTMLRLYSARLPEVFTILIPYALLLSLLFCLGKLSTSREIIAMIQTGRGLARVTTPFLLTGLLATLFCMGLDFQWAPASVAREKQILDSARGLSESAADYVLFRNPRKPRIWMVRSFPANFTQGAPLVGVRVVQENPDGSLQSSLVADTAAWDPVRKQWRFSGAVMRKIEAGQPPKFVHDLPDPYIVSDWRETPAEIIQPGLPAHQLGVPALAGWLKSKSHVSPARATHRTQWHHRFAQPFNCLIMVLLATPLGVVFSRRGASGGVALAVFLSAGLMFATTISLTLGDSGHLPPFVAAWLPNVLFGLLAIFLFQRRLAGRPIYQTLRRLIPNES